MDYISIDIETTGLNHLICQTIEVAAVCVKDNRIVEPFFEMVLSHPEYTFDSVVPMLMHQRIFELIKAGKCEPSYGFHSAFGAWLRTVNWEGKLTLAGKNVAMFDIPFLLDLDSTLAIRHRVLDPGSMYVRSDDKEVPNTEECCKRALIAYDPNHTALGDALQVVELVRRGY